jgi:glycopeptide antibiotics resistance protein
MNLALGAAFAAIVLVTIRPSGGDHEPRLRPLAEIRLALTPPFHRAWIAEIVGNVLLFVPLGAVLCLRNVRFVRSVGVALVISIAVELVQLLLPGRTTAVDDVLCNTAGAALGWFGAWLLHRPPKHLPVASSLER